MPKIPVVEIAQRGELAKPTNGGIDSYLQATINENPEAIIQLSAEHRLIQLAPTSPHTNGDHMVYWVDRGNTAEVGKWEKSLSKDLLEDQEFWNNTQAFFTDKMQQNPNLRLYCYIGFAETPINGLPHVTPVGMQSQPRIHFHLAESITASDTVGEISTADPENALRVGVLLDEGVNFVGKKIDMNGFGQEFLFLQQIGIGRDAYILERRMYAFDSLYDAMDEVTLLKDGAKHFWNRVLSEIGGENVIFDGVNVPVMQAAVPNFVIMMPDLESRAHAEEIGQKAPVWVMAFTTTGAAALIQGGAIIQRAVPKRD